MVSSLNSNLTDKYAYAEKLTCTYTASGTATFEDDFAAAAATLQTYISSISSDELLVLREIALGNLNHNVEKFVPLNGGNTSYYLEFSALTISSSNTVLAKGKLTPTAITYYRTTIDTTPTVSTTTYGSDTNSYNIVFRMLHFVPLLN